jgi:hypothetical protein
MFMGSMNGTMAKIEYTDYTTTLKEATSVNAKDTAAMDAEWGMAGNRLFIAGSAGDTIDEWHCTTDYDASTCTYNSEVDISAKETVIGGMAWNLDGTRLFYVGSNGDTADEWHCTTGYDVSTCTYNSELDISAKDTVPTDMAWSQTGHRLFISGTAGDSVDEWACSTVFDVSTCTYGSELDISAKETDASGIAFGNNGKYLYTVGFNGDTVDEWRCTGDYDVSTCAFYAELSVAAAETDATDISFNPDGTRMYITGDAGNDVTEYDLGCAWDLDGCTVKSHFSSADEGEVNEYPWLTEGILLDLEPDRVLDTTDSTPNVKLQPGDTITITLNIQDDAGADTIRHVSMHTNFGEKPGDMNNFYANNYNAQGETSQSFYEWSPSHDDVAYDYDNTIEWKNVSGYITNADYSELTKDRISISVGDLINEAPNTTQERLAIAFTATFNENMSKSDLTVELTDSDFVKVRLTLPFTIQVGTPDATFEDVMGQTNPGYKFIPLIDESMAHKSIQQWIEPSTGMTDTEFTQLLGIQGTELPSWVKDHLAQWVVEDKIDLAVMIIAVEHLINL